jgi:hypothetical protein
MQPLPNEIIFVSGQRGSGKSYWTKRLSTILPRCVIFDTLGEYPADKRFFEIEPFVDFLAADKANPQFFTVSFSPVDPQEDFETFCRAILARGDIYLIMEELDTVSTPYYTPYEFAKLIKYGRHFEIQIVGVSRRAAEISRLYTSQASRFVIFNQVEPNDLKYWRSIIGKTANDLPNMPDYHFIDADFSKKPVNLDVQPPIS